MARAASSDDGGGCVSLLKMGGVCMMQQFLSALGYQFKNPALLRRALTHPSMGPEDNQRLEFLGTRCCNTSCRISSTKVTRIATKGS